MDTLSSYSFFIQCIFWITQLLQGISIPGTSYITFRMAERKKKLKKLKFTAEEGLNIICSDDYSFGTSSSDDSSSQSSYSDDSSDTNLPSPSQEVKKEKKLLPK